jgi:hypothetical protein
VAGVRTWLRRSTVAFTVTALAFVSGVPALACQDDTHKEHGAHAAAAPKAAASTDAIKGVKHLANLPEAQGAISVSFLQYGRRDVLFVTGRFGLKSYDITADPAKPKLIGELNMPGMWQTENTELDPKRKLIFLARDPRAFGGNVLTGESGVYIVDISRPERLEMIKYFQVPAGHTTSCINDCDYLWTGGPATAANQPPEWGGRPIWVTDVRDPRNPKVFPNPIDLYRNDGKTDYSHDVQVDEQGIAWVSGRGGVRGYHTSGVHRDPLTGKARRATALNPIPYAGGGISELTAASRFMHNAARPVGRDRGRWGRDDLIFVTEESFTPGCATDGVLVIASIRGSYNGQAWRSTPETPFRLDTVGSFSVAGQEGSDPALEKCSAHYFDLKGDIIAQSFFDQGTRFIDVSDPTNPRQIAYFRPAVTASWQPVFHRGLVYVADDFRGVDILELTSSS